MYHTALPCSNEAPPHGHTSAEAKPSTHLVAQVGGYTHEQTPHQRSLEQGRHGHSVLGSAVLLAAAAAGDLQAGQRQRSVKGLYQACDVGTARLS